jgi:hypothetical protein
MYSTLTADTDTVVGIAYHWLAVITGIMIMVSGTLFGHMEITWFGTSILIGYIRLKWLMNPLRHISSMSFALSGFGLAQLTSTISIVTNTTAALFLIISIPLSLFLTVKHDLIILDEPTKAFIILLILSIILMVSLRIPTITAGFTDDLLAFIITITPPFLLDSLQLKAPLRLDPRVLIW